MRSRLLLGLAWLGGTLASIALVWQGLRFEPERRDLEDFTAGAASPGGAPGSTGSSTAAAPSVTTTAPQRAPVQSSPSTPVVTVTSIPTPGSTAAVQTAFELLGGSVAVRFAPEGPTVLWATPAAGFSVEIEQESRGPKVEFRNEGHRSRLDVWWDDGPRHEIEERAG